MRNALAGRRVEPPASSGLLELTVVSCAECGVDASGVARALCRSSLSDPSARALPSV
jgi:hypothetical protein